MLKIKSLGPTWLSCFDYTDFVAGWLFSIWGVTRLTSLRKTILRFNSGFRDKKFLKLVSGHLLSFFGEFKSMLECYVYCSVLLCLWKVLPVTKWVGFFFQFTAVLMLETKCCCSICRVNRSQLSVRAGKRTSNLMLLCIFVFLWKSSSWFKSRFYCFRIKFKTKRCLDFGNQIFTVRASEGSGVEQMHS